jgi:hypothetical protein
LDAEEALGGFEWRPQTKIAKLNIVASGRKS